MQESRAGLYLERGSSTAPFTVSAAGKWQRGNRRRTKKSFTTGESFEVLKLVTENQCPTIGLHLGSWKLAEQQSSPWL